MRAAPPGLGQIRARQATDGVYRHRAVACELLEAFPAQRRHPGVRTRGLHRSEHGVVEPEACGLFELRRVVAGSARERDRRMAELTRRYERELMNPEEALKLGSVSRLVPPGYSRKVLGEFLHFKLRHYTPSAMAGVQRE